MPVASYTLRGGYYPSLRLQEGIRPWHASPCLWISEERIFEWCLPLQVEEILDSRGRGRNVEYLVRWEGFGEEEDSWEPAKNLKQSQDVIDRYLGKSKTVSDGQILKQHCSM